MLEQKNDIGIIHHFCRELHNSSDSARDCTQGRLFVGYNFNVATCFPPGLLFTKTNLVKWKLGSKMRKVL